MPAMYPDRIVISRYGSGGSGGTQDENGGWTPNPAPTPADTILASTCDCQDKTELFRLSNVAEPSVDHDAVCFIGNRSALLDDIHVGDMAQITFGSDQAVADARIAGVRRLDRSLLLKYLSPNKP